MLNTSQRFWIVTLLATSSFGLVSIWAVYSKWSWYLRGLCVALLLSLLLSSRAYAPILFLLLQLTVTSVGISWLRIEQSHRVGSTIARSALSSYSLKDLLFFTGFVGAALSVVARIELPSTSVWINLIVGGCACGVATVLACWLASRPPWPWKQAIVAAVVLAWHTIPLALTDSILWHFPTYEWQDTFSSRLGHDFPVGSYFVVWYELVASLCILLFVTLGLHRLCFSERRSVRYRSTLALSSLLLVLLGSSIYVYWRMPNIPPPATTRIVKPNGYDKFIEATTLFRGTIPRAEATDAELRTFIDANVDAWNTIQESFEVPWSVTRPDSDSAGYSNRIGKIRNLQNLMSSQAELARREGRWPDFVHSCLQQLEAGRRFKHNGLYMDCIIGHMFDHGVHRSLARARTSLPPQRWQPIVSTLVQLESEAEDLDAIIDRDRRWSIQQGRWRTVLYVAISLDADQAWWDDARASWNSATATRRLLIVDGSIRIFQNQHGRLPATPNELRLPANVLMDPFSAEGNALTFRPQAQASYSLYSLGYDQIDNGGVALKKISRNAGYGDYLVETVLSDE